MAGVHDQIFKELIADFPKNFLTLVMPDVACRIDLRDLVFEPGDYFLDSPRGKRRAPDLTAKVRSRASPCEEALIHIEIEYEFREARLVRIPEYNRLLAMRHEVPVHSVVIFNCVATYIELDTRATEEYEKLLRQSENLEVQEMMMTWAEKMEAKGRAAGREQGREEGRQQGREEGLAEGRRGVHDLVLRLLSQRFGRLPASIKRRIEAITSVQELTRLAESVLKVDSLEELGLGS